MGLTVHERGRLTKIWRALASECIACADDPKRADVEALKHRAMDATRWASPLEDAGEAYALFALSRLAVCFVRARSDAARVIRAKALGPAATLALGLLVSGEPQTDPPDTPARRFRADLDG